MPMGPAAAAAAAAAIVTAASAGGGMSGGVGPNGMNAGGHARSGSGGGALMGGQRPGDSLAMDTDWDVGHGPLPSLDLVTGGLRNLHGGRHGGGQGGAAEVIPLIFVFVFFGAAIVYAVPLGTAAGVVAFSAV